VGSGRHAASSTRWLLLCLCAALVALAGAGCGSDPDGEEATVERVADGDTIVLDGGERVRLAQIDAPELGQGECYSRKATAALRRLLPAGTKVRIETDPKLDEVDEYGRRLAYVFKGNLNVNIELVSRGAAAAFFFQGNRGRFAKALETATKHARRRRHGMWKDCRVTWRPNAQVQTSSRRGGQARPLHLRAAVDPFP
jgi:endonuclease YncB( thermonuclease family)